MRLPSIVFFLGLSLAAQGMLGCGESDVSSDDSQSSSPVDLESGETGTGGRTGTTTGTKESTAPTSNTFPIIKFTN